MDTYEQKHKETLKRTMNLALTNNISAIAASEIFPELLESKDEETRKELIHCIQNLQKGVRTWNSDSVFYVDAIAWLVKQGEKKEIDYDEELKKCKDNPLYFFDKYVKIKFKEQGERNPINKAEPKFKVGDWILYSGDHCDGVRHIKQEIERLKQTNGFLPFDNHEICDAYRARGYQFACDDILQVINSLPEEPASEDLDKLVISLEETIGTSPHSREVIKEHLQKAAEWQKQQMKEALQTEYEKGRFDMREEMIKDAVEGAIYGNIRNQEEEPYEIYAESDNLSLNGKLKMGDKVKIIILKTE